MAIAAAPRTRSSGAARAVSNPQPTASLQRRLATSWFWMSPGQIPEVLELQVVLPHSSTTYTG